MKRYLFFILSIITVSIFIFSCSIMNHCIGGREIPLSDVGDMTFHKPIKEGKTTRIPISFNGDIWQNESSLIYPIIKAGRYEYEIHLRIIACPVGSKKKKQSPEIRLKNLIPGRYPVIYHNPDGTIVRLKPIEI